MQSLRFGPHRRRKQAFAKLALPKALQVQPNFEPAHVILAMAFALDGNEIKTRAEAGEVRRLNPKFKFDVEKSRAGPPSPAYATYLEERVIPALRMAGLLE